MPQNLLSRRTLPKPEKDKHLHHTPAWLSSKEAWKHCERRAWECFALGPRTCSPVLTGLYVTAKCFPAKYTRALSHSAMVGIGHGAMGATAVFVPLKENSLGGEGGGSLPPQRAGQPHLASGGKHNSPHPGWAFRSRISLGRKGGRDKKEGEQKKALSSYDSLNKTKPGQGTPCLIRKTHVFN